MPVLDANPGVGVQLCGVPVNFYYLWCLLLILGGGCIFLVGLSLDRLRVTTLGFVIYSAGLFLLFVGSEWLR